MLTIEINDNFILDGRDSKQHHKFHLGLKRNHFKLQLF